MSVLIKGMEMPKRCFGCIFLTTVPNFFCLAGKRDLCAEHGINISRPDWCPLVEVKTQHGRLIDATFEENHYGSMLLNPTPDVTAQDKHNARIIIDALHMAKTVIEAEGETDGR